MIKCGRLISMLVCTGFLIACLAGCGAAAEDSGKAEYANTEEFYAVDDDVGTEGETMAEKISITDLETDSETEAEQAAAEDDEAEPSWEGMSLSVFGDSISTFDGYIPEGYGVFFPFDGEVTEVSQTWWMKLIEDTGMELCANSSSAGSTCVGDSLSAENPKYGCSSFRISSLTGKQGKMPDVIIIYMGTNDLLTGVPIGDNDGTNLVEEGTVENFSDAYTLILDKVSSDYPTSQIYCCTLVPVGDWGTNVPYVTFTNHLGLTAEYYSMQIRIIAKNKGIPVLDLYHCGIEIDNLHEMTTDGVHLTPAGMECVERAILDGMKN